MLEFMKARPQFYTGKFSPDFTKKQSRQLWQELATILNAHPNGAKKEWTAWRKTWIDIKKNSKAKLAREKKHQRGTGGGPPEPVNVASFESKVMELTSAVCVTGNMKVPEPRIVLDEEVLFDQTFHSNNQLETVEETVQYIELDHITPSVDENIDPCTEVKQKESENMRQTFSAKIQTHPVPKRKPRVTKTMRLNESIKNHSKMVKISELNINETKAYRSEKLQVLKEQRDALREQNQILENISVSLHSIIDVTRELF